MISKAERNWRESFNPKFRMLAAYQFLDEELIPFVEKGGELDPQKIEELASEYRKEHPLGSDFELDHVLIQAKAMLMIDRWSAEKGEISPEMLETTQETYNFLIHAERERARKLSLEAKTPPPPSRMARVALRDYVEILREEGSYAAMARRDKLLEKVPVGELDEVRRLMNTARLVLAVVDSVELPSEETLKEAKERWQEWRESRK